MKTKIQFTINNQFRVIWKNGEIFGGYEDFSSKELAEKFIKKLNIEYEQQDN